ncbi:synaptojanin-2-binding protein isoform X3 [Entelurus aequoreus]|uniref:synaptojanin-2-binding protein isoform X3 n=1 Tax=Entelurus aequoreus TaxID=161455 RepID=UPI002B1E31EA|nr:synaptojanin-2-binding protein isoform X3 [Entelurus aequoreus]
MNGSLHSNVVDIELKRGLAGLGFNIVGGVDQPYVANDCGIYVSKIKEDGAAALDGRLEEGDKILMINGVKLEDQTHNEVVNLFRKAGEDVELCVLKKQKMCAVNNTVTLTTPQSKYYERVTNTISPSCQRTT